MGTPTREQWSECLDYLMHVGRRIHFWIGDLLVYGERRWGEMYDEMIERTGYEPRTLRTLKWVAGQIEPLTAPGWPELRPPSGGGRH